MVSSYGLKVRLLVIIKNCSANCYVCADCLLKQIVKLCREQQVKMQNIEYERTFEQSIISDLERENLLGQTKFARKVLELLNIEESE